MKTQIKLAGTKGRGLFANQRIESGQEILRDLCLILEDVTQFLADYVFVDDDDGCFLAMGQGSFVNHGTDPNAAWDLKRGKLGPELVLTATRQIKRGEEILISYNGENNVQWEDL